MVWRLKHTRRLGHLSTKDTAQLLRLLFHGLTGTPEPGEPQYTKYPVEHSLHGGSSRLPGSAETGAAVGLAKTLKVDMPPIHQKGGRPPII